jgi:hypothetical protein
VTAGLTDPRLRRCVRAALTNVLEVNTVPGQGPDRPGGWLRAGAGYAEPWTRDAAINSWLAASWLSPDVAAGTLRAVCEDGPDGPVIAQDDQWWDQVVWVAAAYRHYLLTGDREWLAWADGVTRRSLALARRGRYDEAFGLFRGPAVMADGVSAYPAELLEPGNESSFVLDHPRTHDVFSLSTNLVHAAAYAAAGRMSEALGSDGGPDRARARALVEAVERRLRHGDGYGYLLVPDGSRPDGARLVLAQETLGLALALLGGLVEGPRAHRLVAGVHREPFGVVAVWPHLQEFTAEHPGRHNAVVWPWITGVWVQAVARAGDLAAFGAELGSYLDLIEAADFAYPEVQNARTGLPDGGWQTDAGWPGSSVPGLAAPGPRNPPRPGRPQRCSVSCSSPCSGWSRGPTGCGSLPAYPTGSTGCGWAGSATGRSRSTSRSPVTVTTWPRSRSTGSRRIPGRRSCRPPCVTSRRAATGLVPCACTRSSHERLVDPRRAPRA